MKDNYTFYKSTTGTVSLNELENLKQKAKEHPEKCFRLNLHRDYEDHLQEMVICTFVKEGRFHYHEHKDEIIHLIQGEMKIQFRDSEELIHLSPNGVSFVRIPKGVVHATHIVGEFCIYHEISSGPFTESSTTYYE